MDPNMMDMMRSMSPEQMQAMMKAMPANLSPDMMSMAMAQMKNMKPDDWARAKEEMSKMDPDAMARQATQAQAQIGARQQYVVNASIQLKNEGNQLHNAQKYSEAIEKYERAKANLAEFAGVKEAQDVQRACTLNLSSCYLNLKMYEKCIAQCDEVLAAEAGSMKALYRRGQAKYGLQQWYAAVEDLDKALKVAPAADAGPIRDKLQETKDRISALRAAGMLDDEPPPPAAAAAAANSGRGGAASTSGAAGSAAASGPGGLSPDMMARAAEMMKDNPALAQQAQEMMKGMSDDQLRSLGRQYGVDVDPADLRSGRAAMPNLSPELMEKAARLQAQLPPEVMRAAAAGRQDPEAIKKTVELVAQNPEMMATVSEMVSSLSPQELEAMAKAAGLPPGANFSAAHAKAAVESMKNMSPEQMKEMAAAAASMPRPPEFGGPAAGATGAASSSASRAAGAVSTSSSAAAPFPAVDPKQAAEMLSAMSPEQLSAMSQMMPGAGGMTLTPEMAKMAADMMKNMSADDLKNMTQMAAAMQGDGGAAAAGPAAAAAAARGPAALLNNPSMAKVAADMMANMSPEDMARMQEIAATMGGGPGAAAAGGMPPPGDMASMMGSMNPAMMESAMKMMRNLPPDALADMMMSTGMAKTRTQAEQIAAQMQGMSDTQMAAMMKVAQVAEGARNAFQRVKRFLAANPLILVALVVLVIALLLRRFGYM